MIAYFGSEPDAKDVPRRRPEVLEEEKRTAKLRRRRAGVMLLVDTSIGMRVIRGREPYMSEQRG
jgi:hypothetical protein